MANTPAIIVGMMFRMRISGRMTPMAAIPTPDFAVPYAEPMEEKTIAEAAPIDPKKNSVWEVELVEVPSSSWSWMLRRARDAMAKLI